jgi:beta-lactamase superfamily II metal-dependent hydrolase
VLKVPHHGSETASTQAFIDAVDPAFVTISASTRHHLPKDTVVRRYDNGRRVILRTDENRDNDQDHIVCGIVDGTFDCNFVDVLSQ